MLSWILIIQLTLQSIGWAASSNPFESTSCSEYDLTSDCSLGGPKSGRPTATAQNATPGEVTIDNQNAVQDFVPQSDFSLTTENEDILRFVNGELFSITDKEGNIASDFLYDPSNPEVITGAHLQTLAGFGVDVLPTGEMLITQTDGSKVTIQNNLIQKIENSTLTEIYNYDSSSRLISITQTSSLTSSSSTQPQPTLRYELLTSSNPNLYVLRLEGDITQDGKVDLQDFNLIKESFGKESQEHDVTNDGRVDIADFNIVKKNFGVTLSSIKSLQSSESFPLQITYFANSNTPEKILTQEGTTIFFNEDGTIKEATNAQGHTIQRDEVATNQFTFKFTQGDVVSHHNEDGSLYAVEFKTANITVFYKETLNPETQTTEYKQDYIRYEVTDPTTHKTSFVRLYDAVFDSNNQIQEGRVVFENGLEYEYKEGALHKITSPKEDVLTLKRVQGLNLFDTYTTHSGLTYSLVTFANNPSLYKMTLTSPTEGQDPFTIQEALIDENLQIKTLKRLSGAGARIEDGEFLNIFDANNTYAKTQIENGIKVTTLNPTEDNPFMLKIYYKKDDPDKIDYITKDGLVLFTYKYRFDLAKRSDVVEITEYKTPKPITTNFFESNSNETIIKTYANDLLLESFDTQTQIKSLYSYGQDQKVSKVDLSLNEIIFDTFTYKYEGDLSHVTDKSGIIRTYNQDQKLIAKVEGNTTYHYTDSTDYNLEEVHTVINAQKDNAASLTEAGFTTTFITQGNHQTLITFDLKGVIGDVPRPGGTSPVPSEAPEPSEATFDIYLNNELFKANLNLSTNPYIWLKNTLDLGSLQAGKHSVRIVPKNSSASHQLQNIQVFQKKPTPITKEHIYKKLLNENLTAFYKDGAIDYLYDKRTNYTYSEVTFNEDGTIQTARIKLPTQEEYVFNEDRILEYKDKDGYTVHLNEAKEVIKLITPDGEEVAYDHYINEDAIKAGEAVQDTARQEFNNLLDNHGVEVTARDSVFGGTSLYFNGDNSYIKVLKQEDSDPNAENREFKDYTMEGYYSLDFWIKPEEMPIYPDALFTNGLELSSSAEIASQYKARLTTQGEIEFQYTIDGTWLSPKTVTTIGANINPLEWKHVAIEYRNSPSNNETLLRIYVNGEIKYENLNFDRIFSSANTGGLIIGSDNQSIHHNKSGFFKGYLDEVRIRKNDLDTTSFLKVPEHQELPDLYTTLLLGGASIESHKTFTSATLQNQSFTYDDTGKTTPTLNSSQINQRLATIDTRLSEIEIELSEEASNLEHKTALMQYHLYNVNTYNSGTYFPYPYEYSNPEYFELYSAPTQDTYWIWHRNNQVGDHWQAYETEDTVPQRGVYFYREPNVESEKVFLTINQLVGYDPRPEGPLYMPPQDQILEWDQGDPGDCKPMGREMHCEGVRAAGWVQKEKVYSETGEWTQIPDDYSYSAFYLDKPESSQRLNDYIHSHLIPIATGNRDESSSPERLFDNYYFTYQTHHAVHFNYENRGILETDEFANKLHFGLIYHEDQIAILNGEKEGLLVQKEDLLEAQSRLEQIQILKNQNPTSLIATLNLETLPFKEKLENPRHEISLPATWVDVIHEARLTQDTTSVQAFDHDGNLKWQHKGDNAITYYQDNHPDETYSLDGELLVQYQYTPQIIDGKEEKVLTQIHMPKARKELKSTIEEAKLNVALKRYEAIVDLMKYKRYTDDTILQKHEEVIVLIQDGLRKLEEQERSLQGLGKGKALRSIRENLDQAKSQAYQSINQVQTSQVNSLTQNNALILTETSKVVTDAESVLKTLESQEHAMKLSIVMQEVAPLITDRYRRLLGRDPTPQEIEYWIKRTDYESKGFIQDERFFLDNEMPILTDSEVSLNGFDEYLELNEESIDFTKDAAFDFELTLTSLDFGTDPKKVLLSKWKDNGTYIVLQLIQNEEGSTVVQLSLKSQGETLVLTSDVALQLNTPHRIALRKTLNTWQIIIDQKSVTSEKHVIFASDFKAPVFLGTKQNPATEDFSQFLKATFKNFRINSRSQSFREDTQKKSILRVPPSLFTRALDLTLPDSYIQVEDDERFTFGREDFTLEAFIRIKSDANSNNALSILNQFQDDQNFWNLVYTTTTPPQLKFEVRVNSHTQEMILDIDLEKSVWHHIAITREGNKIHFFINHELKATFDYSDSIPDFNAKVNIGTTIMNGKPLHSLQGHIDGVHISKGIARYPALEAQGLGTYPAPGVRPQLDPKAPAITPDHFTTFLLQEKPGYIAFEPSLNSLSDQSFNPLKVEASAALKITEDGIVLDHTTPIDGFHTTNFLTHLEQNLLQSEERQERTIFVQTVKERVEHTLKTYFLNSTQQQQILTTLGLDKTEVAKNITWSSVQKVLDHFQNSTNLHFGQSAFLAIESLLKQKGIHLSREDIAHDTIAIDILAGVLTPNDTGDLVISAFSLTTLAKNHNQNFQTAETSWESLLAVIASEAKQPHRVIALVNGNHYVVIQHIDQTTGQVTYTDTGSGVDGQNSVVTVSKEDFLSIWNNIVIGDLTNSSVIASEAKQPHRILNSQESKTIRGAFLGILFAIAIQAIVATVTAVVAAVVAIVTTIITTIATLLTSIMQFLAQGIVTLFKGIASISKTIFQSIKFAAKSLFKTATPFLSTSASQATATTLTQAAFGDILIKQVIVTGVSLATTMGLDALGVNPQLSRLLTGFVTGGFINGFQSQAFNVATFVEGGINGLIEAGFMNLTEHFELPPLVGNALSLIGKFSLQNVIPINLGVTTAELAPNLMSYLAQYGLQELGDAFNIDPRISSAASLAFAGTFRNALMQEQADLGRVIFNSAIEAAERGVIAYGVHMALDEIELDPLAEALTARALTGALSGLLTGQEGDNVTNLFDGMYQGIKDSLLNILYLNQGQLDATDLNEYTKSLISFSEQVRDQGFGETLRQYATDIFTADTINSSHLSLNQIEEHFQRQWENRNNQPQVISEEKPLVYMSLSPDELDEYLGIDRLLTPQEINDSPYILVDPLTGELKEVYNNGVRLHGSFKTDSQGNFGLFDGWATQTIALNEFDSYEQFTRINQGLQTYAEIKDQYGQTLLVIEPTGNQEYLVFNDLGELWDAKISTTTAGYELTMKDGALTYLRNEIYEFTVDNGQLKMNIVADTSALDALADYNSDPNNESWAEIFKDMSEIYEWADRRYEVQSKPVEPAPFNMLKIIDYLNNVPNQILPPEKRELILQYLNGLNESQIIPDIELVVDSTQIADKLTSVYKYKSKYEEIYYIKGNGSDTKTKVRIDPWNIDNLIVELSTQLSARYNNQEVGIGGKVSIDNIPKITSIRDLLTHPMKFSFKSATTTYTGDDLIRSKSDTAIDFKGIETVSFTYSSHGSIDDGTVGLMSGTKFELEIDRLKLELIAGGAILGAIAAYTVGPIISGAAGSALSNPAARASVLSGFAYLLEQLEREL